MSQPTTPRLGPTRHDRSQPSANPRTRLLASITAEDFSHGTFPRSAVDTPIGGTSPHLGPSAAPGFHPRRGAAAEREGSINSAGSWGGYKSAGLAGGEGGDGRDGSGDGRTAAEGGEGNVWEIGGKSERMVYWMYYIPCLSWLGGYRWRYLVGDFLAGITMASLYIPIGLSISTNLAHLPPIHGLYGFAIQPLIYAILGSCPTMAVGPEAAGSLLLGSAIRLSNVHHGGEGDDLLNGQLAGLITATAGAIALFAGIIRLGFLDSVLSRPLLRGFISGVGWIICVDQLIPELGLQDLAKRDHISQASSLTKLVWLIKNAGQAHQLTFTVAAISFGITMGAKVLKHRLSHRIPSIMFLPDRFLVVVLSAVLTYTFAWDTRGLLILGKLESGKFKFHFPFRPSQVTDFKENFSTSFLIAVLGFFESVVAAKSMASQLDYNTPHSSYADMNINISSNRELVALGTANMLGGCFQALPAFGGYGRSKVNRATGGKTPISSVILSLCAMLCIFVLLPWFYYLPRCVLSAMLTSVALSLLEEAPEDIRFFWRIKAFPELALMLLIFLTTLVWSLELGIAIGVFFSLIQVIRHSTRSRISILGRVPNPPNPNRPPGAPRTHTYLNAESPPPGQQVEEIDGCLIVKIPEPLTFANTGELRGRLARLERYGRLKVHPGVPRRRKAGWVRWIVFDVKGVTGMDGSGTQCLREIVEGYRRRSVGVVFSRLDKTAGGGSGGGEGVNGVSGVEEWEDAGGGVWELMRRSGIVDLVGGEERFVDSLDEAVMLAEGDRDGEMTSETSENEDVDGSLVV